MGIKLQYPKKMLKRNQDSSRLGIQESRGVETIESQEDIILILVMNQRLNRTLEVKIEAAEVGVEEESMTMRESSMMERDVKGKSTMTMS